MPYRQLINELDKLTNPHILVVGDAMLDHYIIGNVERISPEAPVPILCVKKEFYRIGGAANVAANITALGARATLLALSGGEQKIDGDGEILSEHCRQKNINVELIPALTQTVRKIRVMADRQQMLRVDRENPSPVLSDHAKKQRADLINKLLPPIDVVLVSDYAKGMIDAELMAQLKNSGKKIVVDPRPQHGDLYHGVTLITPNRKEASSLLVATSCLTDEQIGQELSRKFNSSVLLTLGEDGMCLCQIGDAPLHISTRAREVFDVTGAGDTVVAIFALAMAGGLSMANAAYLANAAAGVVVGHIGTATVSLNELRAELAN